jgi:hypothetical protein
MMDSVPSGSIIDTSHERASQGSREHWWCSPKFFVSALAMFLTVHVIERVVMTPLVFIDEGWQLVLSQRWSLGYMAHPPLYTWLQILFFKAFGESIFTLALLKNLLIFCIYGFTYASGRLLTRRDADGVFAALCLMIIPQIGWECHRDLTHSVLLAASTAATLYSFLWLVEKPSASRYALLGVSVGAALLSKYNSVVFIAGFAIAALTVPRYRSVLLSAQVLIALTLCAAVAGPHLVWAAMHPEQSFAAAAKVEATHFPSFAAAALLLPMLMAKAFLPNTMPLIVTYALARPRPVFRLRSDAARMLFRGAIIAIAALGIGLLIARAGGLRGRWFIPVYVCGSVFLVAQLATIPPWIRRLVAVIAIAGAVAVLAILPVNASRQGAKKSELTMATLDEMRVTAGATLRDSDLIIAETFWLGGNMRVQYRKPVATPFERWALQSTPQKTSVAFVANNSSEPSPALRASVAEILGRPVSLRVIFLSSSGQTQRTGMRIGVAIAE